MFDDVLHVILKPFQLSLVSFKKNETLIKLYIDETSNY